MGASQQGQHQTVKTASPATKTASKQQSAVLHEEPQEVLSNQALGRVLQAQRRSPQSSALPMGIIQRQSLALSGFQGLSQELAQSKSQGLVVQPKLRLTNAGDRHEQEADRVANQVVKRINTDPIRKTEATKGDRLMPKATAPTSTPTGTAVTPQFETTLQQQRGQGQAIPEDVREPLEEAFNVDFSRVRIHTNEQAQQLNHSIQAIAFTTGTDIFFKQGAYQPRSRQGQELLAHELTHVVQQNSQKSAIQRKGVEQAQPSNELFPEIAGFVQEISQEIQSFSATWLKSPPTEIEMFPWLKIVKPSLKFDQKANDYSLDIQGSLELNFASDFGMIQPKGTLKINYQSQTKKWDFKSENISVEIKLSEILKFNANNFQYDHTSKSLKIQKADLIIPELNNAKATVENAKIGSNGLDWENVNLDVPKIKLGEFATISNVKTNIAGAAQKYNSKFDGDFGVNLGTSNLVKVEGKGHLTVTYQDGKWGSTHKNVGINGTIANILDFNASDIKYDHENKKVSIATASITIPELDNAKATVEKARIEQTGLDWDKVNLDVPKIKLGEFATISNVKTNIAGAAQKYNSKFDGDFGLNLGTSELVKVEGKGHLTVTYQDGKWGSEHKNVGINGIIANILDFNANDIKYDHENTKVTIGQASITIPKLDKAKATVEKARIDQNGLDWDKVNLDVPKLKLGEFATISNVKTNIAGAAQKYNSKFDGDFGVNLGTSDLVKVEGKGHLTVTYQDGKWGSEHKNVGINGIIANILKFDASDIQYDHENKKVSIATASITIPELDNAKATVEKARIEQTGLNWDKVNLDVPKIKLGEFATISNVKTNIAGAAQKYNSKFDGDFGLNLGTSELVKVEGKGHLTVTYQDGKWGSEHKNVGINGTIANILDFSANDIKYDHENTKVTIGQASIIIPKLDNAKATVEKARIDSNGLDWDKVKLSADQISLGNYASINKPEAIIGGAKDKYNSEFTGSLNVNFGQSDIVKVTGSGKLTVTYKDGKWGSTHQDVKLGGAIANILDFSANDIKYDHENTKVTIGQASITIPKLNDAKATVDKARIDRTGINWDKVTLNAKDIPLGAYAKINEASATIAGADKQYESEFKGAFGVNLGTSNLAKVEANGELTIKYEKGAWSCPNNNVSIDGTVADILKFNASEIQYHHADKKVTIGAASVTISQLNDAKAKVEQARIDSNGLDWDTIKVQIGDISLGTVLSIKKPALTVEGAKSGYSTTASGGVGLHFGEYLNAEGSGKIKLDRSQGGKGKIRVEEAKLEVKGGIKLPGDSFPWPNISLDYPIVPGVEAGLELGIKGGIGASLQGSIAKQAAQDWNLGINPEINGFLEVGLKAKAGVGSAYIAAIQAFVKGGCKADFRGGLKLNGSLKYDEETKVVDASKLLSEYYANAEFKAEISAGVQAQALYFFTKDLYRIRAKCSLGAGKLEGKLEFDKNGKFHIGKPKFSGVIAGEFDKTSIKLEDQSYELIAPEKAEAILKDAAQKIPGSGEKREKMINAVKAGYIRSLSETKSIINNETEKSQKYIKNLGKIDIKLSRYQGLIELAKEIEQEEDSLDSQAINLNNELENEEAKLNDQLETEIETLVNEDKSSTEKSENKHGLLSKLKKAAKFVEEGKDILKDTLIPDGLRKKYHKVEAKYKEKKKEAKKAIDDKRNEMRIKYDSFKKEKKKSFASLKKNATESFPKIADKASAVQSKASNLTKRASDLKNKTKESIKEKTLVKLTELGIKNSQSFVKRIGELTDLQIKYSKKYELHSNFLNSAIEAKGKAEIVLQDVEAAIANLQQLEEGTSMNKLTDMAEQKDILKNVKEELSKDEVNLDDDFMSQIADLEKEAAKALG